MRPVISAARVGEQSAVELKFVKRRPISAIRSRAGVGTTPPKVEGVPYPVSSVMIKSTFGAPLAGSMVAGQNGVEFDRVALDLALELLWRGGDLQSVDRRLGPPAIPGFR